MARPSGTEPSRPAHLSRRRHPAPWSQHTGTTRPVGGRRTADREPVPVFVDESGRRRHIGQMLGVSVGTLVLGYVVVVALTFGGVPAIGPFTPPGLGDLSRPAGGEPPGVGAGAQESPIPTAGAPGSVPAEGATTASDDATGVADVVDDQPATTATTAVPTSTTTTVPRGRGTTTTAPAPASTAPEHTPPGAGRPAEPPGKP